MSHTVSLAVSREMKDALERDAFVNDTTVAGAIRAILVDHLRAAGLLPRRAPPTRQIGANRKYAGSSR